ncbi:hypothetical protein LJC20_02030 [Eubacteriales bacterium OttesenSCG-928-M02]|nr:hypothetical protein [Eubacteriales bacterium OttesenSCG-928-M02]
MLDDMGISSNVLRESEKVERFLTKVCTTTVCTLEAKGEAFPVGIEIPTTCAGKGKWDSEQTTSVLRGHEAI